MRVLRPALAPILMLSVCSVPAHAQSFQRLSDATNLEKVWDVERTPDGGFVTAGGCSLDIPSGTGDRQALIMKYGADDSPEWLTHYGADGPFEFASSVDATSDGGYIVSCINWDGSGDNLGVLKLDASGAVQWAKTYPVEIWIGVVDPVRGNALNPAVREIAGGQFVVVGGDVAENEGFVLRLWPDGSIIYLRHHRVGNPASTALVYTDVKELSDGDFLVSGTVMERTGTVYDEGTAVLVRMDNLGNPHWSYSYVVPGDPIEVAGGVDVSDDGQVCVLTTACADQTPLPFLYTYFGVIHWINPADGAPIATGEWLGFHPALAGVRIDQDARYEAVSAGLTRSLTQGAERAAARVAAPIGSPASLSDLSVETFSLPISDGQLTAVAPPTPNACNWIFAGIRQIEPADVPVSSVVVRTDFAGESACAGTLAAAPNTGLVPVPAAVPITQFNIPVLTGPGAWADGPARTITVVEILPCSGAFCGACAADIDDNGEIGPDDIALFVANFTDAIPDNADVDGDGDEDPDDISAFVDAFIAGC